MPFKSLRLAEPILRAVAGEGYSAPTPIQSKAIPHIIDGRDILGCAQTGTGKTAAFALPILHRLTSHTPRAAAKVVAAGAPVDHTKAGHAEAPVAQGTQAERGSHQGHGQREGQGGQRGHGHAPRRGGHEQHSRGGPSHRPRVLVLSPTRELALQIAESFDTYGEHTGLRNTVIFGGVGQGAQVNALKRGVDIIVATPGRLLDLMEQGYVDLTSIEIFVLDEADRMLDMGFIADIRKIVAKVPRERQTLMFSATMPGDIRRLADTILRDPVTVEVAPVSSTTELVQQAVYHVDKKNKAPLLAHLLKAAPDTNRTLVFTKTKHGADRVVKELARVGITAEAIHGNKRQNVRQRALEGFREGTTPVLVATDIAARGIDIDEIALVINYDLPNIPETYVHRIGRTGRAGASGRAIAFCDREERFFLRDIERLIRKPIPVLNDAPEFPAQPAGGHGGGGERRSHGGSGGHGHEGRGGHRGGGGGHRSGASRGGSGGRGPTGHGGGNAGHGGKSGGPASGRGHSKPGSGAKKRSSGPGGHGNSGGHAGHGHKASHAGGSMIETKPHGQHQGSHGGGQGGHAGHAASRPAQGTVRNFRGGSIGKKR